MIISKVRFSKDGTSIAYTDDEGTKITLDTDDLPKDDYRSAVEALKPYLGHICEIEPNAIHPTGVTFSNKKDKEFVTIVGRKNVGLSNAPFNITSPIISATKESIHQMGKNMDGLDKVLTKIKTCTIAFINGDRVKQEKMFDNKKKE